MSGGQNETPARGQAQPGQDGRLASAAGTCNLSHPKGHTKRNGLYQVTPDGVEPFVVFVKGRDAWALEQLIKAGAKGCTPIKQPAPRWSAYIHNLRALGVPIETVHEQHFGEYPGTHGRYVLQAKVTKGGVA